MEKTAHKVTHHTNDPLKNGFPSSLIDAQGVEQSLKGGMSAARVEELAESGFMPHYRIDGGQPLFKISEVKHWISEQCMEHCTGRALPSALRVVVPADEIYETPPTAIQNLTELQQLPRHGYQPGVYFLCQGDHVVYVGQSKTPVTRIAAHNCDRSKDFDRVYLQPCPASELDDLECALIHHLKPLQQGRQYNRHNRLDGTIKYSAPKPTRPIKETLRLHGISLEQEECR